MHNLPSFYSMANLFLSALFYYFLHISLTPFLLYIQHLHIPDAEPHANLCLRVRFNVCQTECQASDKQQVINK
jgi:hypothetical protein